MRFELYLNAISIGFPRRFPRGEGDTVTTNPKPETLLSIDETLLEMGAPHDASGASALARGHRGRAPAVAGAGILGALKVLRG